MKYLKVADKVFEENFVNYACNVAAIAVNKGRVIAQAGNSYVKTHPVQHHFAKRAGEDKKIYLHAEVAALIKSGPNIDELYIFKRNKNGVLIDSAPCPVCQLAIKHSNVKKVFGVKLGKLTRLQ